LLKEIAPRIARAAVLTHSAFAAGPGQLRVLQSVAPSLGVQIDPVDVQHAAEIERGLDEIVRQARRYWCGPVVMKCELSPASVSQRSIDNWAGTPARAALSRLNMIIGSGRPRGTAIRPDGATHFPADPAEIAATSGSALCFSAH
jgi:hypothetical protein